MILVAPMDRPSLFEGPRPSEQKDSIAFSPYLTFVMPIDYSKWDTLECSDSDDEELSSTPQVTRLQEPSSVTFGGSSDRTATILQHAPTTTHSANADVQVSPTSSSNHSITKTVSSRNSTRTDPLSVWTSRGGSLETADHRKLFWAQDRYTVQLRMELKDKETIDLVTVNGILPYSDRHCATGTVKSKISIWGKESSDAVDWNNQNATILLEGDLPHPVHWSQDDDSDHKSLDWSVERYPLDSSRRFVVVTMNKAVPMHGLFVWWKSPMMGFEEITLDDEEAGRSSASKEFLKSWEEAHRQFRTKKSREPQVLPL